MSLSQFFVLSPRGDTIIFKDFDGNATPGLQEDFFRKVKFWTKGDCPPVFTMNDLTYLFIRRSNLLIACTTRYNVSPSGTLELLNRMAKVFKDYCGILSEESIRKNFILVYELLDEIMDCGFPQITSTEQLKSCVHNEAVMVNQPSLLGNTVSFLSKMQGKTKDSGSSNIPISMGLGTAASGSAKGQKNEIYVDIIERLTVLFNSSGYIVNSSIDGTIMMKSFLSGNPELRLALNEDLIIGKENASMGGVVLDDCNFHERVFLDEFESSRTLHFIPPDGEFAVLNYRITADFQAPFRVFPRIEDVSEFKCDFLCTVRAEMPEANHGTHVIIRVPLPRSTVGATCTFPTDIPGCQAEYNASERRIIWSMRRFKGGTEIGIRVKITTNQPITPAIKREIGPLSMQFEVPMYNVSRLQVRYLRISETHHSYNPHRWVRYITQSSSYICRIGTS